MVSFVTFLKSPGRAGIAYIYSLTEPRKQAYRLGAAYSRAIGQRDKVGGCKSCAAIGSANGPQRLFLTQASTKKCLVHQHKATDFGSVYSTLLEERDLLISIAASPDNHLNRRHEQQQQRIKSPHNNQSWRHSTKMTQMWASKDWVMLDTVGGSAGKRCTRHREDNAGANNICWFCVL